jgi:hypothetical protein
MGLDMGKRLADHDLGGKTPLAKLKADYVRNYVRYLDEY